MEIFEGLRCCRELLCQPTCNQCWFVCISIRGRLSEETHILLNELKVNSLNQKSKSRVSLEIIPHESAPLLPAVAMEISPAIFGWIQHSSWGDMWRRRMCLCEWLCDCVGASIYVCVFCVCVWLSVNVFVFWGFLWPDIISVGWRAYIYVFMANLVNFLHTMLWLPYIFCPDLSPQV